MLTNQPGDEEVVQVSVGEMRNAVAVAEAYDLLVPFFNETVAAANRSVEFGKSLEEDNKQLLKELVFQKRISAGVGAVALFGAGYVLSSALSK